MRPFAGIAGPATLQLAREADACLTVDNWPAGAGLPFRSGEASRLAAATAA
ncbi:hypothetical protein LGH70_16515 [Hymenobacter sp. BT635]|uniref:Uncharacterized protein n=2 Tax=Hymenobacter nitidus TaxID=2880929 RepID=A0ABS8AI84_9BACT|nr:hypothetical protein [Hymenobacter nitidus]